MVKLTILVCCHHIYLIEVDYSLGQFKSAKLKDKEYSINTPIFHKIAKKMDAPNFLHLLADGQLFIYVADAVSPSIIYANPSWWLNF